MKSTAFALAATVALLAGCSGSASTPETSLSTPVSNPTTPSTLPAPPTLPPTPTTGRLAGLLEISGGTKFDQPVRGVVILSGPTHRRIAIGSNGKFTVAVPTGRYTVVGHSPLVRHGRVTCHPDGVPLVVDGTTTAIRVMCAEE